MSKNKELKNDERTQPKTISRTPSQPKTSPLRSATNPEIAWRQRVWRRASSYAYPHFAGVIPLAGQRKWKITRFPLPGMGITWGNGGGEGRGDTTAQRIWAGGGSGKTTVGGEASGLQQWREIFEGDHCFQ